MQRKAWASVKCKYNFVVGILNKGSLMLNIVNILIFDHFTYISQYRFLELVRNTGETVVCGHIECCMHIYIFFMFSFHKDRAKLSCNLSPFSTFFSHGFFVMVTTAVIPLKLTTFIERIASWWQFALFLVSVISRKCCPSFPTCSSDWVPGSWLCSVLLL